MKNKPPVRLVSLLITVSASGWVGTYSLGSFYDHYSTDGRLNALLNALVSHSEKAKEYRIHA